MKAQFVYENINFERGRDPKISMGVGKFSKLIKGLSEFYRDVLPSFNLSFDNITSNDLDKNPHKFVIKIDPIRKDGKPVTAKDFNTIKEMIKEFGWSSAERLTGNGFYPIHTKINNKWIYSKFRFNKPPEITLSYDEMGDKFDEADFWAQKAH